MALGVAVDNSVLGDSVLQDMIKIEIAVFLWQTGKMV